MWERSYCIFCDKSSGVKKWAYENPKIEYYDSVKRKVRHYLIDFYVETIQGKKFLLEIKPSTQVVKPKQPKTRKGQRRYLKESIRWQNNQDKWKQARKFAERYNMEFKILDEFALGIRQIRPKTKKRS